MDQELPKRLYRYYSGIPRDIQSIKESYLWFSTLDKMNDAFEGAHYLEKRNLTLSACKSIIRRTLISAGTAPALAERAIEKKLKAYKSEKEKVAFMVKSIEETHSETYKTIINQGYCSMIGEDETQEESLTEVQHLLMWGHYGKGLSGFRVEFHCGELIESLEKNYQIASDKVIYSSTPPVLDPVKVFAGILLGEFAENQMAYEQIRPCYMTKHLAWSYEQELRLSALTPGRKNFTPPCIKEIVIGAKMETAQQKDLIKIVKSASPKARIKIASISKHKYKIELNSI